MLNNSRLRLCFLAGTLEHGGAERQLFYILQALCRSGNTPRLLCLDEGQFWEARIQALGVSITRVGNTPSRLKRLFRVVKELRKNPPDALQSQHFFANAYAGMAARLLRAGGIGAMRNDGRSETSENGRFGGWLNLRSPRIIAANSQVAIRYAMDRGIPASRLYFLPNVIDTAHFLPADGSSNEPITITTVGRLVKQKRLDRFISILGLLRRNYRLNVRGLIVGPERQNDDLRPALESQAKDLGLLPDALEFRGGVSDMRAIYRESTLCVLTSDYEGTPNVLLEAMASGLPAVASNVGGIPAIVRHGQTGFLVAPDDLDGFAAALAELVNRPELRNAMGREARAFIEENHSLHRLPEYLQGLYQLALPTGRCSNTETAQRASVQSQEQLAHRG